MRSYSLPCFVAVASFLTVAVGCSSTKNDVAKNGEMGQLDFSYTSWSCLLGCGSNRAVLQGSAMTISVDGGSPTKARHARVASEGIASVASNVESCSCDKETANSYSSRGLENGTTTCASDETLKCRMAVEVQTQSAGDAKLEIVGDDGAVVDRFTVHVKPAVRIETIVSVDKENLTAGADGVFEVHQGQNVSIQPNGFGSGDDNVLLFEKNGFTFTTSDEKIVNPKGLSFFEEVQPIVPAGSGTASVTVAAVGAQAEVRFRVVP